MEKIMNIWRLIANNWHPMEMAEWSRREGAIAVGWGGIGDLRKRRFGSEAELKQLTANNNLGGNVSNWVNGGGSLWRLHSEMQIGDLVIISASIRRVLTMRVTGDYYFVDNDPSNSYEHRRKAEVVLIDPNGLWQFSGGMATGENIRRALIRCARTLTEEEYNALSD